MIRPHNFINNLKMALATEMLYFFLKIPIYCHSDKVQVKEMALNGQKKNSFCCFRMKLKTQSHHEVQKFKLPFLLAQCRFA